MQYAALRRKIGGTYRDFFKDSVDGKLLLCTKTAGVCVQFKNEKSFLKLAMKKLIWITDWDWEISRTVVLGTVAVVGDYVEEGWVDKTCRYCKKDTEGAPRTKDSLGRYAHVECAENPPPETGNFFTRLFGR